MIKSDAPIAEQIESFFQLLTVASKREYEGSPTFLLYLKKLGEATVKFVKGNDVTNDDLNVLRLSVAPNVTAKVPEEVLKSLSRFEFSLRFAIKQRDRELRKLAASLVLPPIPVRNSAVDQLQARLDELRRKGGRRKTRKASNTRRRTRRQRQRTN